MKPRSIFAAVMVLGLAVSPSLANADAIIVNNTGNGSTVDGTVDPNWTYTNSSSTTANALVANNANVDFFAGSCCGGGPWTPDTTTSSWLVDNISNNQSGGNPLSFQTTFSLSGLDASTAVLSGSWGIDDGGNLELNGHIISSLPGQDASHWDSASLTAFSVDDTGGFFVAGTNTLSVVFTDNDNAFEGVNVRVSGTASPLPAPAPEPASIAVLGTGAMTLLGFARRRSRR